MNKTGAIVCSVVVALLWALGFSPANAGEEADVDHPEAETFLLLAAEQMNGFHTEYKTYAKDWYRLGFDYAYPTYRTSDPDIYPRPQDKNHWRPRGSNYTYVIVQADDKSFLIQAIDGEGKAAYEVRQDMKEPRKLN